MRTVSDYGRVAVFCGGHSREREISLQSGQAVHLALKSSGVNAELVDTADRNIDFSSYDRAFIALHGRDGEDGKFQAVLEYAGLPYTGSDVASSSLAMNKWHTKAVWQSAGISTPPYVIAESGKPVNAATLQFPVYVKPVNEGSSIGITRVESMDDLQAAVDHANEFDDYVLIEQAISGKEYTYSYIANVPAFPLICLEPETEFYDYEAKYLRDDTRYIVDPDLGNKAEYIHLATSAYVALGLSGWGRVDFMIDVTGKAWFIEANSVPGMTSHSLVPKAAAAVGLDFSAVCLSILETSYV